jgi:hypothetical protein
MWTVRSAAIITIIGIFKIESEKINGWLEFPLGEAVLPIAKAIQAWEMSRDKVKVLSKMDVNNVPDLEENWPCGMTATLLQDVFLNMCTVYKNLVMERSPCEADLEALGKTNEYLQRRVGIWYLVNRCFKMGYFTDGRNKYISVKYKGGPNDLFKGFEALNKVSNAMRGRKIAGIFKVIALEIRVPMREYMSEFTDMCRIVSESWLSEDFGRVEAMKQQIINEENSRPKLKRIEVVPTTKKTTGQLGMLLPNFNTADDWGTDSDEDDFDWVG